MRGAQLAGIGRAKDRLFLVPGEEEVESGSAEDFLENFYPPTKPLKVREKVLDPGLRAGRCLIFMIAKIYITSLVFGIVFPCFAATNIAVVRAVRSTGSGIATYEIDGRKQKVSAGTKLPPGGVLETGPGTSVDLFLG